MKKQHKNGNFTRSEMSITVENLIRSKNDGESLTYMELLDMGVDAQHIQSHRGMVVRAFRYAGREYIMQANHGYILSSPSSTPTIVANDVDKVRKTAKKLERACNNLIERHHEDLPESYVMQLSGTKIIAAQISGEAAKERKKIMVQPSEMFLGARTG